MRKILLLLVMISLLSITFFTGAAMINLKAETIDTVFFITTTPSEDTSTEMNVNWHCKFSTSYLELTLASDTKFENAIKVTPTEKRWSTKGLENENPDDGFYQTRYVCSATLKDLSPRTRYIYRIKFDTYTSDVHSFTTSGLTNDWTFMAIADLQNANNSVVHSFISKLYQACDYPSLVVCSGDLTDTGGDQSQWLWSINNKVFNDFIFATSPGDHEYHASKVASPVPMFNAPHGFNSIFNNPKNGAADVQNSNYYFYYNNVLFVALDMCDSNSVSGSRFTAQENWFKETIEKLKGTYQYLVVYDHKSLYGSQDTDSSVRKKLTARWYPIFDQFNVDVVFSGHDHQYSRTYQLYNNAVSTDELVGTYYADLCCAGNKFRTPSADLTSDGLHECVLDLKETKTPVGARVDVTEEKMVITVIDSNNKTVDSFEIKAKREAKKTDLSGFDANAFVNEMQIDVYNSANVVKTGKLTFNSYQNLKYVKAIEILNKDDQEVCNTNISYNNVNGYSLTNLNSVEYKVKVTLLNGSVQNLTKKIEIGKLLNLKVIYEDDEIYIKFTKDVLDIANNTYKLYVDGAFVKEIETSEIDNKKVLLDLNNIIGNHTYKIELYSDGVLQDGFECSYQGFYELDLFTAKELTLEVGKEEVLDYYFEDGGLVNVSSSDPSIVAFENGYIKAKSAGNAKILININGTDYQYEVNVTVTAASAAKTGCNSGISLVNGSTLSTIATFIVFTLGFSGLVLCAAFRKKND